MPDDAPDIDALLSAARAGDAAARDALLAQSRGYLAVLAKARMEPWMRAKFDASDIVQQTLAEAHAGLDAFDGRGEAAWKAWLKKTLQHNVTDAARREKADKRDVRRERPADAGESSPMAAALPAADPTASRLAADAERDAELLAAVASLPEDYRRVLTLRTIEQRPFEEVAESLGRSVPATQMLWTRAVRKLEAALKDRSELAD